MYKQPENCNRVKSIKSRFENTRNETCNSKKHEIDIKNTSQNLSRQLSDPSRRNIKRTPAFRIDRNLDKNNIFQRNSDYNRSFYLERIQQYNTVLKNSFNNCQKVQKTENVQKDIVDKPVNENVKPLIKSKSSIDFSLIRSKFETNGLEKSPEKIPDAIPKKEILEDRLSQLYTKPNKIIQKKHLANDITQSESHTDLEINTEIANLYAKPIPKVKHANETSEIIEVKPSISDNTVGLTDTLKAALKKPLPNGPAPQKPPRTFEHVSLKKAVPKKINEQKHDPRYMLNKLELALRNKKIPTKKINKTKSLDNSLQRQTSSSFLSNFDCFNNSTTYERINEPNSTFFVEQQDDEPVYAEPWQDEFKNENVCPNIKSLYYMSTSLLNNNDQHCLLNMETSQQDDKSSLSSNSESGLPENRTNIKQLINSFENGSLQTPKLDRSHNLEELRLSLHKTLRKCLDDDSHEDDTMCDKFQEYVKTMPKYQKMKFNDSLFYCCLIVGCDDKPNIKFRYPPNVKIPDRIEDLCYPEIASGPLDISNNAQCYSLVITNDKGERIFGYCRRVIPEGSTKCIPLTYCLLSKHRAPRFFKKILIELESRHGVPDKLRDEFIQKLYRNKFPKPGESLKLDSTNVLQDLEITLHHDTRYEETDLKQLHELPANILLKIFASLLLERKVILISCVISKLSSCVDALQSILYPFSWPHTFIPILPQCLWEVVESPTPVICGILSVSVVNNHKIEHGIVVDLDEGTIISEQGDEDSILSCSMKKTFFQGMTIANSISPDPYIQSVYLSDAYLKVFIVALKHYKNHIHGSQFEKEAFIKNAKSKGIRTFLKWFTETTMFVTFLTTVISNPESFSLFDQKIEMYGSTESNLIITKLLDWKK